MHRSLPVSMCGGDLPGLHALTTPPRRWVDPPQGPLPRQSSVAWAVDLIHSVAPIQVAVGRKERLFLAIGCAPSRRRFAPRARPCWRLRCFCSEPPSGRRPSRTRVPAQSAQRSQSRSPACPRRRSVWRLRRCSSRPCERFVSSTTPNGRAYWWRNASNAIHRPGWQKRHWPSTSRPQSLTTTRMRPWSRRNI